MNLNSYSFDTHPLVWYFLRRRTLSANAQYIIRKVFAGEDTGYLSIMVVLEAFHIGLKNQEFDFSVFLKYLNNSNIKVVPFDKYVLAKALTLPREIDIHDRIIVATAIIRNAKLVTKDRNLRSLFPLETVW